MRPPLVRVSAFSSHWKARTAGPVAVTESTALLPCKTVRLAGWLATVSDAPRETVTPAALVTTTVQLPASATWALAIVRLGVLAPETRAESISLAPLRYHWYPRGPMPIAATENVALLPMKANWAAG